MRVPVVKLPGHNIDLWLSQIELSKSSLPKASRHCCAAWHCMTAVGGPAFFFPFLRDYDVQEVIHTTSAAGGSAKSILLSPERNEENTG